MIGSFGRCEVLSFHATKFFNTFEGGAIVTNDDALAAKTRLMRNFGFAGLDDVIYIGTNGKMCEASAAMGLTNLEALQPTIARNRETYEAYREELGSLPGLRLLQHDDAERRNYQYIVCEIDSELGIARDDLVQILHMENVRARRYFWPGCHRMEPYRSLSPRAGDELPVTEAVAERVLVLPHGGPVEVAQVRRIGALLRWIAAQRSEVAARLAAARASGELSSPRFSRFGVPRA
jgi:dTDP-4-amino-4,6-dideoxygalactose transaminase